MYKAILVSLLTLLLGIYSSPAVAQQQEQPARKSAYTIIIKENGEEKRYDYNSLEELRNDPRLKDQRLPGFEERGRHFYIDGGTHTGEAPFMQWLEKSKILRDSAGESSVRLFFKTPEGAELKGEREFFQYRMSDTAKAHLFRLRDSSNTFSRVLGAPPHIYLKEDSIFFRDLPQDIRERLLEQKAYGEEERIIIFRSRGAEAPALPPLPDQPPLPDLPVDTEMLRLPEVERGPDWLEELSVYPNPSSTQLNIRLRSASSGPGLLRLIDSSGKVVYEEQLADAGQLLEKSIPVPKGNKGLYLLQLQQGKQTYTHRVLLN